MEATCNCGWKGEPLENYAMGTGTILCCPSCGDPFIRIEYPRDHKLVEVPKALYDKVMEVASEPNSTFITVVDWLVNRIMTVGK